MAEIVDINGYEGLYAVTDDGRVWSHSSNKWLKSPNNTWGYPKVCLYVNGKGKVHTVHRLVAEAFCVRAENCTEVNHIDGDKANNVASNLEWVTPSQNAQHAWDTGLRANNYGIYSAQKARRAFSRQAVVAIRQMIEAGWSQASIARLYECSKGSIYKIASGQSYREVEL